MAGLQAVRRHLHHLSLQPEPRIGARFCLQPRGTRARHDRAALGDGSGALLLPRARRSNRLRSPSRLRAMWPRRSCCSSFLRVLDLVRRSARGRHPLSRDLRRLSLARSGMESSFFVFLVLGSLASIASRRIVVAAVFAGLAALTRPEGVLLLALFRGCLVVSPRRNTPQERRGNRDCRASGNRRRLRQRPSRTRLDRRCRNQLLRRLLPSKIRRLRSSAGTTWGCFS